MESNDRSLAAPVASADRIASLDVLRGLAVLGILVMNIRNFGLPIRRFDDPTFPHGYNLLDLGAWGFANLLFRDKFIALFSMLFGAGIVLMTRRAEARGAPVAGPFFRRHFWLLVIGVLHAFLIWYGDILEVYAVAGAALFVFRRRKPATLVVLGVAVFSLTILFTEIDGLYDRIFGWVATLSPADDFRTLLREEGPVYRGGWFEMFRWRASLNWHWHVEGALQYDLWRCAGMMLIGMACMKTGVLEGLRSTRFYARLLAIGYGVGLPLGALALESQLAGRRDLAERFGLEPWRHGKEAVHLVSGAAVALGHVAFVLLIHRAGRLAHVRFILGAVGRMALTNYLFHSVLCVTLFEGWGFGRWARLGHAQLLGVVGCVWAATLIWSPLWFRRFRFGPMEWLWRTLTYMKPQPMRTPTD
jgi:uncharacterized protein